MTFLEGPRLLFDSVGEDIGPPRKLPVFSVLGQGVTITALSRQGGIKEVVPFLDLS